MLSAHGDQSAEQNTSYSTASGWACSPLQIASPLWRRRKRLKSRAIADAVIRRGNQPVSVTINVLGHQDQE
jgi:hypothetical protein